MFRALLLAVAVALLATLAALYISCPAANGVDEAWEPRIGTMMINAVHKFAEYSDKLGFMDEVRINQWFARTFSPLFRGKDYPLVQTAHSKMAGTPVVIYNYRGADTPEEQGLAPAIIFIHGGGWVVMNTDYYHQVLQRIVAGTKLMLVSVEGFKYPVGVEGSVLLTIAMDGKTKTYTLAPDSLFPGPVHENAAVVKFFLKNAHKFGKDKNRVIVLGDSAGGNLVAAVNLLLREEKVTPQPIAQVLVYPYLQFLDMALPSYQSDFAIITSKPICVNYGLWYLLGHNKNKEAVLSNKHVSAKTLKAHGHKISHSKLPKSFFPDHYRPENRREHKGISEELDKLIVDPLFSPLMAENLSGLPKALIQTCRFDVLRDEGFLYAQRLQGAGVEVRYINYNDSYHGAFLRNPIFADDIIAYIGEILQSP